MIKYGYLILLLIIYKLFNLNVIGKIIDVILPFLFAFVLAYICYPIQKKLKKLPKFISILLTLIVIVLIIYIIIIVFIPLIIKELIKILPIVINYINVLMTKYNINLNSITNELMNLSNYKYLINGISISIEFITKLIITIISFFYFLIYMEKIENYIKHNQKLYDYIKVLSNEFYYYINGLIEISIITFFEYSISFYIFGYSDYLLIGIISSILNLIPYLGSIITLFIIILLEPSLIIKTSILYLILGNIDSYIINPYIYNKSNNITPIVNLFSISIGSLFGIKGILLAVPITIIIYTTFKLYKNKITTFLKLCYNMRKE